MSYSLSSKISTFDRDLEVEIKSLPIEIKPEDDLYKEIHKIISDAAIHFMETYQVSPSYLAGNGDDKLHRDAIKIFTDHLTEEMKISIKVSIIYYNPMYYSLTPKITFGLEITQEILDEYRDRHKVELASLLDSVFGSKE